MYSEQLLFSVSSNHGRDDRNRSSSGWPSGTDQTEAGDSHQLLGKRFRGRDDCGDRDNVPPVGPTKAKRIRKTPRPKVRRMSEEARQKKNEKWRKRVAERWNKPEEVVELEERPCDFIHK